MTHLNNMLCCTPFPVDNRVILICPGCGYKTLGEFSNLWMPKNTKFIKYLCVHCRRYNIKINIVIRNSTVYEFLDIFENLIEQREI